MSAGAERIDSIRASYLQIPLERPYRLSFGPVTHYDTILLQMNAADGRSGFGEATLLTGYTDETIAESWDLTRELVSVFCGKSPAEIVSRLDRLAYRAPFVCTAFHTALDMLCGHPLLSVAATTRVPILGLLQGEDESGLRHDFDRLCAAGNRTVKVKVGFDVHADLRHLALIQKVVAGRALIRVDANQGFSADDAAAFINGVDPAGIELFEQPCAAGDWAAHRCAAAAAARTGLPLMLDESIYGLPDIERAVDENACTYLKVKLMKFVSLDALVAAIERIRALGKRAVLGNGVAGDVSCWMEACVAARHIDNAGEMNGFLKARRMLLAPPLRFEQGDIVLEPGAAPALDPAGIKAYQRDGVAQRQELH
ncbi:MAG: enolase C-terminal domain-like protein [Betaproteobacteria bacterium]